MGHGYTIVQSMTYGVEVLLYSPWPMGSQFPMGYRLYNSLTSMGHGLYVIGHYFHKYFLSIFDPSSLHIPYPTFLPYVHPSYVLPFYAFMLTNKRQEHIRLDYGSPNNSSTGLPTFRNSPVVVPLHLDPALEPPLLPLNAPTTQSSGLPGHGVRVGVRPPHEDLGL